MFIYTENDAETHRNIQNINIYPQNTPTTRKHLLKLSFCFSKKERQTYFQKSEVKQKTTFYADLYGIIYILC